MNENLFDGGPGKTLKRFHVEEEVVRKSLRDPDKVMWSQLASMIHSLKPARIFHSAFSYNFGYLNIKLISKLIHVSLPSLTVSSKYTLAHDASFKVVNLNKVIFFKPDCTFIYLRNEFK